MPVQTKYGGLKMVWHPEKLDALRKKEITAPIYVRIKPTNRCNHRCFYCSYDPEIEIPNVLSHGFRRNDEIPKEKMMEILDDFRDIGVKAITFSGGGEPLVYPYIIETLKKCLEYGIDVSIITNGQLLNGERAELLSKAKWVRISSDAVDAKTFCKIRNVPENLFNDLIENIRNFVKIKDKKCELGINFIIHHLNAERVYNSIKFFKDLGVNHVKTTPRWIDDAKKWIEYHEPFRNSVVEQIKKAKKDFPDFDIYDTYEKDLEIFGGDIKSEGKIRRGYNRCYIMETVPVIGADSVVYFCHDKTYNEDGALGSIKDKSFKDLWFSKEAEKKFRSFNPEERCSHCVYDSRNIFIKDVLQNYGEHVNFP